MLSDTEQERWPWTRSVDSTLPGLKIVAFMKLWLPLGLRFPEVIYEDVYTDE